MWSKNPWVSASCCTNSNSSTSTAQKPNSTGKLCYRCKAPYSKEYLATCKAQNAICEACGVKGHYKGHAHNLVISQIIRNLILQVEFTQPPLQQFQKDSTMSRETGFQSLHEHKRNLRKFILKADTGSDVNAINTETFQALFLGVEL